MTARSYQAVLVATFCALLCIPGVTMIVRPETVHMYGVKPVRFPPFEQKFSWLTRFEAFFTASFGQKERLIQLHNELGYRVVHDLQSDNVLVGRHGWMFLKQDYGWDSFRSEEPPSDHLVNGWRTALTGARAFLSAQGIPLLYVIVPSKETIYPDLLPLSAVRARSTTRLDEMLSVLQSANIDYVDLRPELREARKHAQVYDQIDSHWNGRGAQAGATRVLGRVAEILHRPQSFADLDSHFIPSESEGDLSLILALQNYVKAPSTGLVPNRILAHRVEPPESVLEPTRQQQSHMTFEVPDDSLPKALILRDSFSEAFMPTFSEKFRRTVWLWTHDVDLRLVVREAPDIVIVEMTERFFAGPPPKLLTAAKRGHK